MAVNGSRDGRAGKKSGVASKIVYSLLLGLVAFGVSWALDTTVANSSLIDVGVSVFVTGVAFITQFLVDVESQVEQTQALVRDELRKVNAATELFALVEASQLKTELMTQLIGHATAIPKGPELIFRFAETEIDRLSRYLRELGQGGNLTYDGEDRDWLLGLTRSITATLDATSLSTVDGWARGNSLDEGLWASDLGVRYLEAQREAIRRGVRIRRLFIVDHQDPHNHPDLTPILRQHAEIGIGVRTLVSRVTDTQRMLFDFIVMDGVLTYEPRIAVGSRHTSTLMVSTTIYTDPDRVQDRVARFEDLWAAGDDFVLPPAAIPAPRSG